MRITQLSAVEAAEATAGILAVYRDVWIDSMPSAELGITPEDIREHFSDLETMAGYWRVFLGDPTLTVWAARDDMSKLVGFSAVKRDEKHQELEFAFVLPEHQGTGLGRQLIQAAMAALDPRQPITLEVAAHNQKARALYAKLGFKPTGEAVPDKILKNGKHIPWLKLMKSGEKVNERTREPS